ncbi:MAG: tetratricopeptide repeat protein, partial [bacterium]|nr:tetratricopeptide repeat protein [bacterium]
LLILFGLMSSSLRSLIILGTVLLVALIIHLVKILRGHIHSSAAIWALISAAIVLGAGFLLFILFGFSHLSLAGVNGLIDSHMEYNWRTWRLIQAYFFTGSGLGVYPMVLSTYNLLIQVPFIPHAESTFLQVWIEQGLLGLIAFIWLVFAFYIWIWKRRNQLNMLAAGALVSATTMLCHDLMDVSLYSTVWLPLMFVPIGLTVASTGHSPVRKLSDIWNRQRVLGAFLFIILGLVSGRKLVMPALYTNLGSIYQTRLELGQYKYPDKLVEFTRRKADYSKIEPYFRKALALDPGNVSANQRLAMLALERNDYAGAVKLLETARARDKSDPVTLQMLGSAYLGSGRLDEAYTFWSRLPDAPKKLDLEAWVRYETRGDNARVYQARNLAIKIMAEQKLKH